MALQRLCEHFGEYAAARRIESGQRLSTTIMIWPSACLKA
jgi:hypothetical protein